MHKEDHNMLGEKEQRALDALNRIIENLSYQSLLNVHDESKFIQLLVDLYREGSTWSTLNGDLVYHWALEKGWPDEDAITAKDMCFAIYETLRYVGMIPG
jgi:hypothetical protein